MIVVADHIIANINGIVLDGCRESVKNSFDW
jgi:hypothetical protein